MTLYMIKLSYTQACDWCDKDIYAGEIAWYNHKTKQVYHEGECQEKAEGI